MTKNTTIQIKKEVHNMLKEYCNEQRRSLSGFVEKLILDHIKQSKYDKKSKVLKVK